MNLSLLREKFIIKEKNATESGKPLRIVCQSTRLPIDLSAGDREPERYIVRSHNMHTTVQLAATIIDEYQRRGPLLNRAKELDWGDLWDNSLSDYEKTYGKNKWVCVYHNGHIIFSTGEHHSFFDVVEKCDLVNKGDYEVSLKLAKDAFSHAGTDVDLDYDRNFALITDLNRSGGRCSLVLRGTSKTTTFNYTVTPITNNGKVDISKIISIASNFLEGVQLAFVVGSHNKQVNLGIIKETSKNHKKSADAQDRIDRLNTIINLFDGQYVVNYRTERPDFYDLIEFVENHGV